MASEPDDLVTRARAALEGVAEGPWDVSRWEDFGGSLTFYIDGIEQFRGFRNNVSFGSDQSLAHFVAASRTLVPELAAEVERLRAAGPWVEHVEFQRAMKRERDGDCVCDRNPETSDGPQEFCPWHGRPYLDLVDLLAEVHAELNALRGQ